MNMKNILMAWTAMAAMAVAADTSYLYWMVDTSGSEGIGAFSYATVRESGTSGYLQFYNTEGQAVGTDMAVNNYSATATSGTAAGPLYTGLEGTYSDSDSFIFELWLEGTGVDSLVGWQTYSYGQILPYVYSAMNAGTGDVPLQVHAVPEPTSALLLLLGMMGLVLKRRKKLVTVVVAAASLGVFASAKNLIYDFRPSAEDRYADGSPVLDYESYALVWLPTGSDGVEITADCKVADESKGRILRVRKSFRRGELFTFQVDASLSEPCVKAGGSWAVYLLDTRVFGADGVVSLAETAEGVAAAVNASVKIDRSVVSVTEGTSGPSRTKLGAAGRTLQATSLPAGTPQPRITGVEFVNGEFRVKVADTVPYVSYNLAAGETPDAVDGKKAKAPRNGVAGGEIELAAPAGSGSGFFRVNRN